MVSSPQADRHKGKKINRNNRLMEITHSMPTSFDTKQALVLTHQAQRHIAYTKLSLTKRKTSRNRPEAPKQRGFFLFVWGVGANHYSPLLPTPPAMLSHRPGRLVERCPHEVVEETTGCRSCSSRPYGVNSEGRRRTVTKAEYLPSRPAGVCDTCCKIKLLNL